MAYTRDPAPCGTRAAYGRHRYRGEPPCDPCREARNAFRRDEARAKGIPARAPLGMDVFWSRVEKSDGCWIWRGPQHGAGYGTFGSKYAHRVAYEALIGPVPSGLVLDHTCRNKACVNPAHLEAVTVAENNRRTRRTHCARGHEMTPENTLTWRGSRRCRRCRYPARYAA